MATDIQSILASDPLDVAALGSALEALPQPERIAAVRAIGGKAQRRIWDACEGHETALEDFVPAGKGAPEQVIHSGKNSLPVFTEFEKRFTRTADDPSVLYGYNEASVGKLIGPGFFVAHYFPDRKEIGIDYLQVPPEGSAFPDGWPALKPNTSGLQRFVYNGMIDYMRKVSAHVTIGRAYRGGTQEQPNYFLLCRNE